MVLIVGLILISIAQVFSENPQCCNKGEDIVQLSETSAICRHSGKNVTSNLAIQCSNPELYVYDFNYTVIKDTLVFDLGDKTAKLESGDFCFGEVVIEEDPELTESALFHCQIDPTHATLNYCGVISAVFCFLTAVIYAVLPEMRDLLGKSVICLCLSLGIAMSMFVSLKVVAYDDMNICALRGVVTYFWFMATFVWMSVISYHCLRSLITPSLQDSASQNFVWYSICGWGVPVICTGILSLVNFLPGEHEKPGIGEMHCWFKNIEQQRIYFFSVLIITMTINLAIFAYLVANICRTKFASNHIQALKFKLYLSIKLFIAMGLPFIVEIISSFFHEEKRTWVVYVMDIATSLQGIVMFLVLVICRKRVIKAIHRRRWFLCLSDRTEKYLAVAHDDEEDVIEHTSIPLEANGIQ